jgi:hypothetical protein
MAVLSGGASECASGTTVPLEIIPKLDRASQKMFVPPTFGHSTSHGPLQKFKMRKMTLISGSDSECASNTTVPLEILANLDTSVPNLHHTKKFFTYNIGLFH